ncbi:thioredoxin family protein [Nannochloropsis oceanica]
MGRLILTSAALVVLAFQTTTVAFQPRGRLQMIWGGQRTKKPVAIGGPVNEPKPFSVRPDKFLDVATASTVSLLRAGSGAFVQGYKVALVDTDQVEAGEYTFVSSGGKRSKETSATFIARPKQPIILYEFQGCPFCAKVREVVSILDLDVLFYPCPRDSKVFRPEAISRGGKSQFPYMVDPNTKVEMYESADIIQYLVDTYGTGETPSGLGAGTANVVKISLALLPRFGKGSRVISGGSKVPSKPLIYWGYEASPFCRLVKEKLNELELPHVQKSCARGSAKRKELQARAGKFLVPFIEDPNTGVSMYESAEIMEYLEKTYAA